MKETKIALAVKWRIDYWVATMEAGTLVSRLLQSSRLEIMGVCLWQETMETIQEDRFGTSFGGGLDVGIGPYAQGDCWKMTELVQG